jgi:hypothetical protein
VVAVLLDLVVKSPITVSFGLTVPHLRSVLPDDRTHQ